MATRSPAAIAERHVPNDGQQTFRAANLLREVFNLENDFEILGRLGARRLLVAHRLRRRGGRAGTYRPRAWRQPECRLWHQARSGLGRLAGEATAGPSGTGTSVVNASVSGETSGGGLQRLPRALELHQPAVVIVELGANDGLRGLNVSLNNATT